MELQENARLGLKQCGSMSRENDKNKEALKKVLLRERNFICIPSGYVHQKLPAWLSKFRATG